jgi:putative chitinase
MNLGTFFSAVRPIFREGKLSKLQVSGTEFIIYEWNKRGYKDLRWLAYMLATTFHETAQTMQPIEEYGKGKGRAYGKKLKMSGIPYTHPNQIYYGRGYVQLTWYENYELMGRLLHVDLLNHPEIALEPHIAAAILFEGMTKGSSSFGDFTGRCLEHYFNDTRTDWVNARRIINGTDCASLIAGYAGTIYNALQAAT